jgi:hypothetical protein
MRFSFTASASGHFCIAYANAQETRSAVGGNAAETFVGENSGGVRKTKMAPQKYGAIHKK